jgi:hypothetical protein
MSPALPTSYTWRIAGWSSCASASASSRNQARASSEAQRFTRTLTWRLSRVSKPTKRMRSGDRAIIRSIRYRAPTAASTRAVSAASSSTVGIGVFDGIPSGALGTIECRVGRGEKGRDGFTVPG